MAHVRAGPFAANQKLTSAAASAIDLNAATSCDTTASGDSLLGPITITGASGALTLAATAVNGLTIQAGSKIECSGALNVKTGSTCTIQSGGTLAVAAGATCTIATTVALTGALTCSGAGAITMATGTTATVANGATLAVANGGTLTSGTTSTVTMNIGTGSYVQTVTASGGRIYLGNGATDLVLSPARTRSISTASLRGTPVTLANWVNSIGAYLAWVSGTGAGVDAGQVLIPLDVHDGATISTVTMYIKPGAGHGLFPGGAPTMPTLNVKRQDASGVLVSLNGTGAVSAVGGTAALFEAGVTITYTANLNNIVDKSLYKYFAIFQAETGANALGGCQLLDVTVNMTGIADMRAG